MAILIYTSGTTGPPKGAMISHRNILDGMDNLWQVNPGYLSDELLSFLPLCHIAERRVSAMGALQGGLGRATSSRSMETVPENMREVSPTVFFAVPRIWEKFYSGWCSPLKDSTRLEKLAFRWAMGIGRKVSDLRLERSEPSRCI